MAIKIDRYTIYQALSELSDDKLKDVFQFIRFLQFTEQSSSAAQRTLKERLAADYDLLAANYDELADELADETWLPAENEALQHIEGTSDEDSSR